MTDARLGLLGLGRLDEIILALFQLLCYASQYSTGKGTVNRVPSVMIGLGLHLTGTRSGWQGGGGEKKKSFSSGRSA